MHTGTLRKLAMALTFWLAVHAPLLRADQTITGNLTVTANGDFEGNSLSGGTRTDTGSYPGWVTVYTDGTTATVEYDASRPGSIWKWQENGSTALKQQMTLNLSGNNELVLYDESTTPAAKITLNPLGTSTIANSLTVNGTDNEMASQTLVNGNSIVTESLGDGRYILKSATTLALFPSASATGTNATALGYQTTASGNYSVALGENTSASGIDSFAAGYFSNAGASYTTALGGGSATASGAIVIGRDTASGTYSLAMGKYNSASGTYSTAMGYLTSASGGSSTAGGANSIASGNYATALGSSASALGTASTALGESTASAVFSTAMGRSTASSNYATAMGNYSIASGLGATAMGLETLASGFCSTASGCYATASGYSSAATGYKTIAQAAYSSALGKYNLGGGSTNSWVATDPLFELGNGTYGTPSDALVVYKNGNAALQGTLKAAPGGDIPMFSGY